MGYLAASVDMSPDRQIANAVAAGRAFTVSCTQTAGTGVGAYQAISLFWTARNTKIMVYSAKAHNITTTANNLIRLHKTTSDPALAGHSISPLAIINALAGAGAASSGANLTSATEGVSTGTGTTYRASAGTNAAQTATDELLRTTNDYVIIPANVAGGVILMVGGALNDKVNIEMSWIEI